MKDWDVKSLMLKLLETQKKYVREDLAEYSTATVAVFRSDGTSYLQFPKYENEDSKIEAYSGIVGQAKQERAVIIITVNSALTAGNVSEHYRWGDLNETNSQHCVLITASGPGVSNVMLQCAYDIQNEAVLFQEPEFTTGEFEVGLLPDRPDHNDTPLN